MVHSQRIKILGLIVLLLVPYAALGSFIIDPPEQVNVFTPSQGEGWLTGWQYRKSHTITGSAGAGTDYQVRIIVHRTTGTDSGENVYLDSHCLTNFADVRFADDDGNTELDYWMEEKTDYDDATFWVEIADSLESANVNIYVYYGNIDVSTTSSGANTFLFYEDWATQSVRPAVWDVFYDTGGSMSYSSTDAQQGGYVAKIEGSAGMGAIGYESDYLLAAPHALMFRAKVEATVGANQELRIGSGTPTLWPLAVIETGAGTHVFRSYDEDGNIDDQTMDSSLFDGYHAFEITRSGTHARLYADGVLEETGSCDPDTVSTSIASFSAHDSGYYLWSDWFAGRKYIASEPAHDSWGRETAVGGESWLSGWNYRQRYTISGAAGAGVNYQIKILVEYGFGSSSSGSVYCELHCQTDFGDIRFTDNDGDTQLDYWMEEKTDSDDATFWVEVADDLGSNQSIYVYYGTTGTTTTTSSGANTFPLFDDFNRADSTTVGNGWTEDEGVGNTLEISNNRFEVYGYEARYCHIERSAPSLSSFALHGTIMMTGDGLAGATWHPAIFVYWGAYDWCSAGPRGDIMEHSSYRNVNGAITGTYEGSATSNVWYHYRILISDSNVVVQYSTDYETWTELTSFARPSSFTSSPTLLLVGKGYSISAGEYPNPDLDNSYATTSGRAYSYYDNIFVRKYTSTEPAHSTTGAEESVTDLASTTTVGIVVWDPLAFIATVGGVGLVGLVVVVVAMRSRKGSRVDSEVGVALRKERLPSESRVELPIEKYPPRVPREITPTRGLDASSNVAIMAIRAAAATPRVIEQRLVKALPSGPIQVATGFDAAGENLKLAVKVSNTGELTIANVQVILDVPDGFEFVRGTTNSQNLGTITGGGFQSAIFWLRPQRCVDGEYGGTIIYKDAKNKRQTIEIPSKRLVNICPMLSSTERADEVFTRLKAGSLSRNCASFEFSGGARSVFMMANARLSGLTPVDHSEHEYEDGVYLGYSYYVGETKYGESQFASEIQVSGTPSGGVLTLSIYSDDERILSGFFVDVMDDVRKHVEILEEKMCPVATCAKCGASLNLDNIGENRIYRCDYCGAMGKVSPWMA